MNKNDLKQKKNIARLSGESEKVLAIDSVISEIDLVEARNNKTLDDDGVMSTIKKTISQLEETAKMYSDAGRAKDAAIQNNRIEILTQFLPKQMSENEIKLSVDAIITTNGYSSMQDMGKVMSEMKQLYGASLDMKVTSNTVRERLSK